MYKKKIKIITLIIFAIFIIDQISKKYIIGYFDGNDSLIYINSFLNFDLIWNNGIAFGLLGFENSNLYNLITIIIILVILMLLYIIKETNNFNIYFYSMIVGGALGNLVDRINFSAVTDFIDFHLGQYHWFVFNVADIFISTGVICLIIAEIFIKNNNNEKN